MPKTSGQLSSYSPFHRVRAAHSTISKSKLGDENNWNVGNEKIGQIFAEKESPQAYGPSILENVATAVTKFWQTETRSQ